MFCTFSSATQHILIHKAQEVHCLMYGSIQNVEYMGHGWWYRLMNWHRELKLRSAQVIKQARNKASLEGLQSLFCELCQHTIEQGIKEYQLCNMDDTGFVQNKTLTRQLYRKALSMFGQSVLIWISTRSLSYVFPLLSMLLRHCCFYPESGRICMLSRVDILRLLALQQNQKVLSNLPYS